MLTTLRIRNLALVEDLTLDLPAGFLAVTGETGAGKSILIGALNLLVGERADRNLIRAGAEGAVVEATFDVRGLRAPLAGFLQEQGIEPCEGGQLLLKRAITAAGASRQFVNGSATTVATLAGLGEWLVDMHGPHDHQSLLFPARQLDILDAFAGLGKQREILSGLGAERSGLERERAGLSGDATQMAQQQDLLRHQVHEIAAARLTSGEDVSVEEDFRRASSAARLLQHIQAATECLDGEEGSLRSRLGELGRTLQEMKRLDPGATDLAALQELVIGQVLDLHDALRHYAEKVDIDPARLRELEERMDLIQSLKRKYGGSAEAIVAFGEAAQERLRALEGREVELARLQKRLESVDKRSGVVARELTSRRLEAIPELARSVRKELNDLGFRSSHFEIHLASDAATGVPLSATGWDRVEFLFAPNPGEPPRPLRTIASSGEMARVMLALKTVLAAEDDVLVLVFDEIDANVGGETARVVGEKMCQIATRHQVLCITHLAPVAAGASAHFEVSKRAKEGRTVSSVRLLSREERVAELARMLGGQGEAARRHAEELLRNAPQVSPRFMGKG